MVEPLRLIEQVPLPHDQVLVVTGETGHSHIFTRQFQPFSQVTMHAYSRHSLNSSRDNLPLFEAFDPLARPPAVIMAIPNPVQHALEHVDQSLPEASTLILPQTGIAIEADITEVVHRRHTLIRATVFASFQPGNPIEPPHVALAQMFDRNDSELSKVEQLFQMAGFETFICPDHYDLEWSKLLLQSIGSSGIITGLSNQDTFANPELFRLELNAWQRRVALLNHSNIELVDFPWFNTTRLAQISARLPEKLPKPARTAIATHIDKYFKQFLAGSTQAIRLGHYQEIVEQFAPFTQLAEVVGMESPMDAGILNLIDLHRQGKLNLTTMTTQEKITWLIEAFESNGNIY